MEWKNYEEKFDEKIASAIEWLANEFTKLRTGRVTATVLEHVKVESYGELVPLQNVANISAPEARTLIVKPYDMSTIKDIAAGINQANIGVNPQVDADKIRLNFPPLTEDMRKDLVKKAKVLAEDTKVKIRKVRQDIQDMYKKDAELTDDQKKSYATNLDNVTKKYNTKIDEMLEVKTKDIMVI